MALNRPDVYLGVAFNADPFDSGVTPTWSDLTARCYSIGSAKRGRQYELDRNQAGNLDATWHNADEALNPANTGSPYSPNVVPYRQLVFQAMWPATPVGAAVNLINSVAGYDPTFESYTNGQVLPWATPVGGTTVAVSNVSPQAGSNCVGTGLLVAGSTVQGFALGPFQTIPGRQYTASAQVRPGGAFNVVISIQGGATGGTANTAGSYTRISVTFTATQPRHTILIQTSGTVTANTVKADQIQLEPGASPATFASTGPIIRPVWTRGYVERWPAQWDDSGFRGVSSTPVVGPFAILANADLHTEIRGAIMAKAPTCYWHLQEPNGATTFAESSGNNGPPLLRTDSPVGVGPTFAPGTTMNVAGDVGGTGVRTAPNPGDEAFLNRPFSCLQLGYTGPTLVGPSAAPNSATNWGASMAVLMTRPAAAIAGVKFVRFTDYTNNGPVGIQAGGGGNLQATLAAPIVADAWGDNLPHLYVVVTTMAAPTVTTTLYVDGVQVATGTASFPAGRDFPTLAVNLGGAVTYTFNQAGQDQTTDHLAYWNRALTGAEITDLGNAARGYPGETPGARVARYLALGGYTGITSIQPGMSTMGAATVKEGDDLLDTCQHVTESEFGNFFEYADGVAFAGRNDRYLKTTSSFTFGENVAGGEYPYEGDISFDFDPQLVLNIADVTRSGGIKAHAEDATGVSQKRYGKKNFTRTVDTASDNEAQDAATWTVANRKDPLQRVASITFSPATVTGLPFGDGTLWPMVLMLEIGTRVTVKRRPKAANAGAGITMTGDYFIESINHHDIDFEAGTWLTTVELSPVNRAQPWILEHATYGVLDSTTILGF